MSTEWTELTYMQIKAGNTAMFVFGAAVVFVFLVLAAQYESWTLPLAVILVVPMCLLCSLIGVYLRRLPMDIFVQIGFVVLVGLACKNAILIIEFAKQLRSEGKPRFEATTDACRLRLRPILMTSFAFILGVLPMVTAQGAGAEMRWSLGTAVFSGMVGVTLFGIFLTPVFFYVIESIGESTIFAARRRCSGSARLLIGGGAGLRSPAIWSGRPVSLGTVGRAGRRIPARHHGRGSRAKRHPHRPRAAGRQAPHRQHLNRPETNRRDLPLFHRPADLCGGAVDRADAGGRRRPRDAADRPISGRHSAHGARDGFVPRGQRADRARHRRRPDRAAGQRRREHAVHVVAIDERRCLYADGDVQAGHGFGHGPGAGAEPCVAGAAGHSESCATARNQRQEDVPQHDDDRQSHLA